MSQSLVVALNLQLETTEDRLRLLHSTGCPRHGTETSGSGTKKNSRPFYFSPYTHGPELGTTASAIIFMFNMEDVDRTYTSSTGLCQDNDREAHSCLLVTKAHSHCGYLVVRQQGEDCLRHFDSKWQVNRQGTRNPTGLATAAYCM